MTEHESALADLYDHEVERAPAGDRRQAPDWGGDDLFTSIPRRRRFEHAVRADRATGRDSDAAAAGPGDCPARGGRAVGDPLPPPAPDTPPAHPRRRDAMELPIQRSERPPVSDAVRRRSPL